MGLIGYKFSGRRGLASFVFHLSLDDIVGSAFYLVEGKFGGDTILSNGCQTGYTTREVFKGNDVTFLRCKLDTIIFKHSCLDWFAIDLDLAGFDIWVIYNQVSTDI